MRIAYLFGSLNRGGTETLMLDVCRNLENEDFTAIGIYRKSGILESDFLQTGLSFYKLSVRKNILRYLWQLRKLLLENNINIVHAQQPIDAVFAKFASIGANIKIVLTLHGFDNNILSKNKVLNFILKRTDTNIYVSNYQKEYYKTRYKLDPKKQTVVYNGVSFDKFKETIDTRSIRDELSIPSNTLLMGMIGNFNEVRDQLTVCKFLNLLNKNNVDFQFLFIGKRVEKLASRYDECVDYCIQNKLKQKVSFLGLRNDIPQILAELDVFVYSTDKDTFGIAVVEAMSMGIPVFVNDWSVMSEITEQGKYATIYKTKSETDLFEKFMVFLYEKELYKQSAENNIEIIRKKYNIQNHIQNLKQIYSRI